MPTLTLSMIVKNEEKYLRECLESVKNIVDDIVIVDTGSTDKTIEIAKGYNAKIFHYEWVNDFSAARNYALQKSEGEWILYMDADERFDKDSVDELHKIIQSNLRIGYYCTVKSIDNEKGRDNSIRYVRLFKNSNNLSFTGKVHEQIVPSLQQNNYELAQSSLLINHIGYNVTSEEKEKKANRNLELLLNEYRQNKSSYIEFQIGQTYSILNNYAEAEKYFLRAVKSKSISSDLKAESYAYLAHIHHSKYNMPGAEKYLSMAIDINPMQPYYYLLLSKITLRKQNYAKAKLYCKKSFELNKSSKINMKSSAQTILINPEEILYYGLYIAFQTKDNDYTDYFTDEFLKITKSNNQQEKSLFIETMRSILKGKKLTEVIANDIINFIDKNNLDLFIEIIIKQNNEVLKHNLLERLNTKFPHNTVILKNLASVYEQMNRIDNAVEILEGNIESIEKDAGALFYLASYYLRLNKVDKSIELFTYIENNFSNLSEMLPKIKLIKDKLLTLHHR